MILIGRNQSPFVRRVAVSLTELGFTYEQKAVSALADAEVVRGHNPLGRVPALVIDGGETLVDSAAILDYLDETVGPDRALTPAAGPDRRAVKRIEALAVGALEKGIGAYYELNRRPAEKIYDGWVEKCREQSLGGLAAVEAMAGDGWLVGGRLTQADITVACALNFLQGAIKVDPARDFPRLGRLLARMQEHPSFAATKPAA